MISCEILHASSINPSLIYALRLENRPSRFGSLSSSIHPRLAPSANHARPAVSLCLCIVRVVIYWVCTISHISLLCIYKPAMRPQVLTSALLSASRFYTTTAAASTSTCPARVLKASNLVKTCAPTATTTTTTTRLFSTSPSHSKLVKPQAETTESKQEIRIPTPSTPVVMAANSATLLEAFKARRSFYQLNKELPTSKDKVTSIVQEALVQVPSSFNSQSNRVLVLYGAEHDKLWDITSEVLKPLVPADSWDATAARNAGFKAGAGTVLFFIDTTVVSGMQEKFALYKDRFPTWAEHSTAMLQFACWTTLEAEGLGANLQHYNPLIDERVAAEWNIPSNWQLTAQLVFGGRAGEPGPKDHLPLDQTFKVAGA
ncbi:Nitroreductase-like protein [Xylariaceae sp. FL1651]|nr:Nitroreductase-like protein [Xylariaceae sp. FL1651]